MPLIGQDIEIHDREAHNRRCTDHKSENDRLAEKYGTGMTRSLGLCYGVMMIGVGLDMLGVRYALIGGGVVAGLFFLKLCYYSRKMNALIQQEKKE